MGELRLNFWEYELPLKAPLETAYGVVTERQGLLVSLGDGEHIGWGDAASVPGWSSETLADCKRALESAMVRLEHAWGFVPRCDIRVGGIARAGVAGAYIDLLAKRRGVSVASFLRGYFGGEPEPRLSRLSPSSFQVLITATRPPIQDTNIFEMPPTRLTEVVPLSPDRVQGTKTLETPLRVGVNGLVSSKRPEAAAEAAAALAADGFAVVKLKVGAADSATDIARVAAVRAVIGDEVELRLDANGAWDVDEAIDFLKTVSSHNIAYCEEPTSGIPNIAEVGRQVDVPVAVDESAMPLEDFDLALATKGVGVVVIKPQAMGGPDLAGRAILQAVSAGKRCVITSIIDSAIGVTHAAHLAAALLPNEVHGLATSSLLTTDVAPAPDIQDGTFHVPIGPGLGINPNYRPSI